MSGSKFEGVVPGLSFEEYRAAAGINQSALKDIRKTPLAFWTAHVDPSRAEREDTKALRQGRQIHTAVLEPELFHAMYARALNPDEYPAALRTVEQFKSRLGELGVDVPSKWKRDDLISAISQHDPRAYEHVWDLIQSRHNAAVGNKSVIQVSDWQLCLDVQKAAISHPVASEILSHGAPEVSIFWRDEETGEDCKLRADWLIGSLEKPEGLFDLKTTDDASEAEFQRSIFKYDYHVQVAWYLDGLAAALGHAVPPEAFIFGAVEKKPPFDMAFYFADQAMIDAGRAEYRRRLLIYSECKKSNNWPGLPHEVRPISLPAWAMKG